MKRLRTLLPLLAGATLAGAAEPPLTLAEARTLALAAHPRITVTQLRALVAQEGTTQAKAGHLPTVALNATAVESGQQITRITAGTISNSQIFDHVGIGATLSLLVTDFGRTTSLTQAARQRAKAAAADAEATRGQVMLQVNAAFLDVLRARAVQAVAAATLANREAVLTRTGALAQNQLRSELDVRFARVSADEARLLVNTAEKDVLAALAVLANLIGEARLPAGRELAVPAAPGELESDAGALTSRALQQRPELTRARAEIEAARASARAAREARLPTLALTATAGYTPTHDPRFQHQYSAGALNLNVPLFTGGLYRSRQHEAELQANAADAASQEQVNLITRDVRLAWLEAGSARDRIGLTRSLLDNAEAALALARARFEQGLSSTVELTQAELSHTSAAIAHASAEFAYRLRRDILDYQTGALR